MNRKTPAAGLSTPLVLETTNTSEYV